ncbi:MAG: outer membrane protein assembly factor BamE [Rhodospirillales bacterium]|nr:outer membrane protein assembly factor BamE [Rhodospirillales bacterium]
MASPASTGNRYGQRMRMKEMWTRLRQRMLSRRFGAACLLALGAAALSACEGRVAVHGNPIDPDQLARLAPGRTSKTDVVGMFGSPSNIPPFDDNTWLYMSNRERTLAFFAPNRWMRQVVVLTFDASNVLQSVETLGLEDGREVELVSRETPSFGQSPTVIQQMLGNLGRFNTAGDNRTRGP